MREHQVTNTFFDQIRRRMIFLVTPLFLIPVAISLWIGARNAGLLTGIFIAGPLLLVVGFFLVKAYRQQRHSWASYRLISGEAGLKRTQAGQADVEIRREEITRMVEYPGQSLTVFSADPLKRMTIPVKLEGYAELRANLSQWHPIEEVNRAAVKFAPFRLVLIVVLGALALILFWTSANDLLVISLGFFLLAMTLVSLFSISRAPQAEKKAQEKIILILALLVIATRMILALVN